MAAKTESQNARRGEVFIPFAGKLTKFRWRANEIAVFEERIQPYTLADFLRNKLTGPRVARELVYAGLMYLEKKDWNPIEAGKMLDAHMDLSEGEQGVEDITAPAYKIILATMPEMRRLFEGVYNDAPSEGGADGGENPTRGGEQTDASTGTASSEKPSAQG